MPRKTRKQPPLEDQLARLEDIASLLEHGSIPLADLLALYEEGMQLTEQCREFLETAEQKVTEIQARAIASNSPDSESQDELDTELQF
ncbi:MAG: exodeoxyribonuclease VII small subunit [Cyanobacteria bacterium P01_E01_bin.34]